MTTPGRRWVGQQQPTPNTSDARRPVGYSPNNDGSRADWHRAPRRVCGALALFPPDRSGSGYLPRAVPTVAGTERDWIGPPHCWAGESAEPAVGSDRPGATATTGSD